MKEHRKNMSFSKPALEALLNYPWPGNIRELQNTMERIVLICPDGVIMPEMLSHVLPFNYQKIYIEPEVKISAPIETQPQQPQRSEPTKMLTKVNLEEIEKESILQALINNRGIQTKAAAELGISARQIGYKMKKFGIDF